MCMHACLSGYVLYCTCVTVSLSWFRADMAVNVNRSDAVEREHHARQQQQHDAMASVSNPSTDYLPICVSACVYLSVCLRICACLSFCLCVCLCVCVKRQERGTWWWADVPTVLKNKMTAVRKWQKDRLRLCGGESVIQGNVLGSRTICSNSDTKGQHDMRTKN